MTEDERIERFEAAYNRIDRALSEMTDSRDPDRRKTFAARVRHAANRYRRLRRHVDFLLEIGDLRNAIIHNRLGDGHYIAVPHESTVTELEEIERVMFSPEKVIPRFQRHVRTLEADATIADAWELVRHDGYSRYPVYERGTFIGMLTANGFARWCAAQAKDGRINVDGRTVLIRDVLPIDHRRDFVAFASAESAIEDVAEMFRDNPRLEAVIVTPHGRLNERPVGLICPADVLTATR
ncbi:MAG: CBS domain-containing protein [Phycisphaeraceae bacterium]|nr:CBS domain-containing protein [Phycisphaerales bacterium]QOJ16762.1 MAG: CBS domain-containing protein [Phycisphaeraceae bacterium]